MSKALSLKLNNNTFENVEEITKKIKIPRNKYINQAVEFFNSYNERKLLKKQLKKESLIVRKNSMKVLKEYEKLDDEIFE